MPKINNIYSTYNIGYIYGSNIICISKDYVLRNTPDSFCDDTGQLGLKLSDIKLNKISQFFLIIE